MSKGKSLPVNVKVVAYVVKRLFGVDRSSMFGNYEMQELAS